MDSYEKRSLPTERSSITHKFEVEGNKGIVIVGMYEDGTPGEVSIKIHKAGSTVRGFAHALAETASEALQYGVPLRALVKLHAGNQFPPYGLTKFACIPHAKSIVDYIFRWLGMKFISLEKLKEDGVTTKCDECGKAVWHERKKYACIAQVLKKAS